MRTRRFVLALALGWPFPSLAARPPAGPAEVELRVGRGDLSGITGVVRLPIGILAAQGEEIAGPLPELDGRLRAGPERVEYLARLQAFVSARITSSVDGRELSLRFLEPRVELSAVPGTPPDFIAFAFIGLFDRYDRVMTFRAAPELGPIALTWWRRGEGRRLDRLLPGQESPPFTLSAGSPFWWVATPVAVLIAALVAVLLSRRRQR